MSNAAPRAHSQEESRQQGGEHPLPAAGEVCANGCPNGCQLDCCWNVRVKLIRSAEICGVSHVPQPMEDRVDGCGSQGAESVEGGDNKEMREKMQKTGRSTSRR